MDKTLNWVRNPGRVPSLLRNPISHLENPGGGSSAVLMPLLALITCLQRQGTNTDSCLRDPGKQLPLELGPRARSGAWALEHGSWACSVPAAAAAGVASGGRAVETGDRLVLVATVSGASLPAGAPPSPAIGTPWRGRGDTKSMGHWRAHLCSNSFSTFLKTMLFSPMFCNKAK